MMTEISLNVLDVSENSTRAGASLVTIRVTADTSADKLTIVIADNGCGMTREELERAAEPFYTKSINGIGLGLAIVKKLTDLNGGFFQMESQPGEGTRVSLWFPAGEEETDEPDIDSRR